MTGTTPLSGLRVLDLTELLPGPYATQQLAEMGAEVIKVERPGGDAARVMFPGLFAAVNRDKKSIVLNLKDDADRAAFLRLAKRADVVIEGYRPGVTTRLGIDYETLSAINPGLVYCSVSGYGQTGPARDWPGHDLNYAAMAGAVAISGAPDGPPIPPVCRSAICRRPCMPSSLSWPRCAHATPRAVDSIWMCRSPMR